MGTRRLQGDNRMAMGLAVATAQAVEALDAVAWQAGTLVRASDVTLGTAIAAPAAPTAANTAIAVGSSLTNALTGVKISYQFPWGEGALSTAATATPTAGAEIKLTGASLPPPSPALWTNIYVETAAGSGTYKLSGRLLPGAAAEYYIRSYGAGNNPAASPVNSGALELTQYAFAQMFAGISNQRKVANLARIFGNSLDNIMMIMRAGIFESDCVATSITANSWVAPASTGNNLLNQQMVVVADSSLAIGKTVSDNSLNTSKVQYEIISTLVPTPAQQATLADAL